jgi:hypothetical protein
MVLHFRYSPILCSFLKYWIKWFYPLFSTTKNREKTNVLLNQVFFLQTRRRSARYYIKLKGEFLLRTM